ncbi:MAG TPA: hypothetical protein VGE01_00730 [Fimbriimonas sp.]
MRRFLTPFAALMALSAQAVAPVEWKYTNSEWDYEAVLPRRAQRVQPGSSDAGDVTFRIEDAAMDLWFHAKRLPQGTSADDYLASMQRSVEAEFGPKLALNVRKRGFLAMSWREGDMIHYRKGIARGSRYARLYMIYPVAKKQQLDPVVIQASRSFRFR